MKVQELLSSENKWTQEVYARDKDEQYVSPYSPEAVKWCLLGAIRKCYPSEAGEILDKIYYDIRTDIGKFNDTHSYEEVMEFIRRLNI